MQKSFKFSVLALSILGLLALITIISLQNNNADRLSASEVISSELNKINLITELSSIIHSRTRFMQSLLLNDAKHIDQSLPQFSQINGAYRQTRQQLLPLLNARETEIMEAIDRLDRDINELNRQVSVLFLNGSKTEASDILLLEVLPKTAPLLSHLSELTQAQRLDVQKIILTSTDTFQSSQNKITLFATIAVLISLMIAAIAVWYGRKVSFQLRDMNAYLELKIHERTESLLDTQRELIEDNTELSRIALSDSLTGLSNRAHMNQLLHKEFSRFERHKQKFCIIMLDIDHFKQINDKFGHDVGDMVMVQIADRFKKSIRTADSVARWGGEEFLFCCAMTNQDEVQSIAENIRHLIADEPFETAGTITVSLGCAQIEKGEEVTALIKRADIALYEAKNNGRNQTVFADFSMNTGFF